MLHLGLAGPPVVGPPVSLRRPLLRRLHRSAALGPTPSPVQATPQRGRIARRGAIAAEEGFSNGGRGHVVERGPSPCRRDALGHTCSFLPALGLQDCGRGRK